MDRRKDIKGNKYGRLTAVKMQKVKTNKHGAIWLWHCDCGKKIVAPYNNVVNSKCKSCGCLKKEYYKTVDRFYGVNNVEGTCPERIKSKKPNKNSKSGTKGVFYDKTKKKWHSKITFQGINYDLGRFKNKSAAIKARKEAEKKLFIPFLEEYYSSKKENN